MSSQLQTFIYDRPGSKGLNTAEAGAVLDPSWAATLRNTIIDSSGRIAARNGWSLLTSTGNHSEDTVALGEYVANATTVHIISAANAKLYSGTQTLSDKTGALTPSNDDWQFLNFNGKCIGVAQAETMIVGSDSGGTMGNFASVVAASGTVPNGNCAVASHGRLWAIDNDYQTLQISALLDETHWSTGAVSVSLANVWPGGLDNALALAIWENQLVVFGERSVLFFLGLDDPATDFAASGAIQGTLDSHLTADGVVSRDAVVSVGTDLIYLSRSGLRSVRRGLLYKGLPLTVLCPQTRDLIIEHIDSALTAAATIKLTYHRPQNMIVAKIGEHYWAFDIRNPDAIVASRWYGIDWLAALHSAGVLYMGHNDGVSQYTGYDDGGTAYTMRYLSAHTVPAPGRIIMPKTILAHVEATGTSTISATWSMDYGASSDNAAQSLEVGGAALYGTSLFGTATFGPARRMAPIRYSATRTGSEIQMGIETIIDGQSVALQRLDLIAKVGRAT